MYRVTSSFPQNLFKLIKTILICTLLQFQSIQPNHHISV